MDNGSRRPGYGKMFYLGAGFLLGLLVSSCPDRCGRSDEYTPPVLPEPRLEQTVPYYPMPGNFPEPDTLRC